MRDLIVSPAQSNKPSHIKKDNQTTPFLAKNILTLSNELFIRNNLVPFKSYWNLGLILPIEFLGNSKSLQITHIVDIQLLHHNP